MNGKESKLSFCGSIDNVDQWSHQMKIPSKKITI